MWMFLRPEPASQLPEEAVSAAVETASSDAMVADAVAVDATPSEWHPAYDPARSLARRPWPGADCGSDQAFVPILTAPGSVVPRVRVYLHPGRRDLGAMELDRIARQFDMRSAPLFGSLGEAELAADAVAGFLLEVGGPFDDAEGRHHERGVFFVAGLA